MTTTSSVEYPNSPRGLDFEQVSKQSKIDQLNFDASLKYLKIIKNSILELEDLNYREYLTPTEIQQIDRINNELHSIYNRINSFSLQEQNNVSTKNQTDQIIANLFNNSFKGAIRDPLTFLRQELGKNKNAEADLQKTIANIKRIEKDLAEKQIKLNNEEERIKNRSAIVSSKDLSGRFQQRVDDLKNKQWLYPVWIGLTIVLSLVSTTIVGCIYFFYREVYFVTSGARIEYGILSSIFIGLQFYLLRYFVRRQNILLHNVEVNTHRTNISETIENFLQSGSGDQDLKNKLLESGVTNMFNHDNTGYLTKDQMDTSLANPAVELIKTLKN
jgi:hypothetical protein